jgi:hypothetical protein
MSNYKNLDFLNVIYKDPLKKISNIFYSQNNNSYPVILNTPTLILIKSLENNSIQLKVQKNDKSFIDFLLNMDELNKSNCLYNSEKWFSKTLPFDYIEKNYESLINDTILSFPLPMKDNKLVFKDVYDIDNNKINYFDIKENTPIELKIKYVGLKFSKNKFYPIIKILNIKSMVKIEKTELSTDKMNLSIEKTELSRDKTDNVDTTDISMEKKDKVNISIENLDKVDISMENTKDSNIDNVKTIHKKDVDDHDDKDDRVKTKLERFNGINNEVDSKNINIEDEDDKDDIEIEKENSVVKHQDDIEEYIDEKQVTRKNRRKKIVKTKINKNI